MKKNKYIRLCYRCENRARYLETKNCGRYECSDTSNAVYRCYAYKPVMPLILEKDKKDKRPQFCGTMFNSRSSGIMPDDKNMILDAVEYKSGTMLYWKPKKVRKNAKGKK